MKITDLELLNVARRSGAAARKPKSFWDFFKKPSIIRPTVELAEFAARYDARKVVNFYRICLEEFPGQREIKLPLYLEDLIVATPRSIRSELRLTMALRDGAKLQLSIRDMLGDAFKRSALERIVFY